MPWARCKRLKHSEEVRISQAGQQAEQCGGSRSPPHLGSGMVGLRKRKLVQIDIDADEPEDAEEP